MPLFLLALLAATVPTAQYNNARTGANTEETVLTPRNVTQSTFGRLLSIPLDGDVFAQPLYVSNTVFVATEHNSVYALDPATGAVRWHRNFGAPVPERIVGCPFIPDEVGITATPVIDVASKTMYFIARTTESDKYYQRLHALDIATGAEKAGSPVLIRANSNGAAFHSVRENPRAALLLDRGKVYIAWGSSCDVHPYYGWILAYDAATLQQAGVFNAAPHAGESGFWQSDAGIAADENGNVYAVTGNGKFTAAQGGPDYGDSVLRLRFGTGPNPVQDYFTPYNQSDLNAHDDDLGSCGPVLLPDHFIVVEGKAGVLYLIDRRHMGGFHAGSDNVVQTVNIGSGMHGVPAYWNGHLYTFANDDVLKEFSFANGKLSAAPSHYSSLRFAPGASPVVSANGAKDGIVWVVFTKAWNDRTGDATLHAFDAADVSRQLFSANAGPAVRFTMPLVADGRVFVGSRRLLLVFGVKR